jgi:hypothetical protein
VLRRTSARSSLRPRALNRLRTTSFGCLQPPDRDVAALAA